MNATISKIKFILLACVALSVVHCSKGGGGTTSTATSTTCPANQLYTSGAGCLPTCGTNMVYYNNQCVSSYTVTGGGLNQCTPTYVNGQMTCGGGTTTPIGGGGYGYSRYGYGGGFGIGGILLILLILFLVFGYR